MGCLFYGCTDMLIGYFGITFFNIIKGRVRNKLVFLALRFRLDLTGTIERNRSNSNALLRISRLRVG